MLESVVDHCPRRDTLLVLGDFNASTGTDRDGYETRVGPHGSGTMNQNSTKFLDFARSHGFRVTGSWFLCPQAHRGLGIPMLVLWQRRLTMCSLMDAGQICSMEFASIELCTTPSSCLCLFVCLCAGYLKKLWTDSDETWWTGWALGV